MASPPSRCPECGRASFSKRYATGGGWRVVGYRCDGCGHVVPARGRGGLE